MSTVEEKVLKARAQVERVIATRLRAIGTSAALAEAARCDLRVVALEDTASGLDGADPSGVRAREGDGWTRPILDGEVAP